MNARGSSASWLAGSALACTACTVWNDARPCEDVALREEIVNSRQDGNEFLDHSRAAAVLDEFVMVAFTGRSSSQSSETDSSVRLARLSKATGASLTVCTDSEVDRDLSGKQTAFGAAIASARLSIGDTHTAALVSWTSVVGSIHQAQALFVDDAGCPKLVEGSFDPFGQPMSATSIAWSEARQQVLAIGSDGRDLWATWIDSPAPARPTRIVTSGEATLLQGGIVGTPALAIAEDGTALIAWFDAARGFRVLALGPGQLTGKPLDAGIPVATFDPEQGVGSALAAGTDRFTLVGQASAELGAPAALFARQFSLEGAPLGAPRAIGAPTAARRLPNLVYLPLSTLLVTWYSADDGGTVGQLFREGLTPRFCALGCGEGSFAMGARGETKYAASSVPLAVEDSVWLLHDADDPREYGVFLARAAFAELYPAKP